MNEEAELNLKIPNTSLQIKTHNPELSKYLDEMTITIPNEEYPQTNNVTLSAYYDSLNLLWNEYFKNLPDQE